MSVQTILGATHTATARAEVLLADGTSVPVSVAGGTVQADAKADVRRTCTLEVVATSETVPVDAASALAPGSAEVRVWRGVRGLVGDLLEFPLGVFPLTESRVEETREGITAQVSGSDRSLYVRRNVWDEPYVVEPGDLGTRIRALLLNRYPQAATNFVPTTGLTTAGLLLGTTSQSDPWADAQAMARAGGLELLVDPRGTFVLRPIPDPRTAPLAWDHSTGPLRLLGINRGLTSERSYSRVVVTAESTGLSAPLRAVAEDTASPRRSTYFFSSAAITTQGQAQAAADALLNDVSGLYEDVSFSTIVDPSLDVGTVGLLHRPSVGASGRYVLEQLTIPLSYDQPMTGTCRGQRALR